MPLFTEIAQVIVRNLNVTFSKEEKKSIEKNLTTNPDAYLNYLSGNALLLAVMERKNNDSGTFISAIKMYDKAIEYDPDFAPAYIGRSKIRAFGIMLHQLDSSNIYKSWSDITNAIRINADLPDIQMALGLYYYFCKQDYLNALMSFNNASIKDPENYEPLFYMAMIYRHMGESEKLHLLLNKFANFNTQVPLYLTNIGTSYDYLHNYDSALIYCQKAIDLDPNWDAPYLNKIQSLVFKYGNTKRAHTVLDSMNWNTGNTHMVLNSLLDMYDGNYAEAFAYAYKSSSDDFGSIEQRYLYLAKICSLMKDTDNKLKYYDSASISLKRLLRISPDDAWLHISMSLVYAGIEDKEKSINEANKAIELSMIGKDKMAEADVIVEVSRIYTMLGLTEKALQNIEYLLKNPSYFSVKILQIDPDFKNLIKQEDCKRIIERYTK